MEFHEISKIKGCTWTDHIRKQDIRRVTHGFSTSNTELYTKMYKSFREDAK
jgi:hypothetical protein